MSKNVGQPRVRPNWVKLEFYLPVNDQLEMNAVKAVTVDVRELYNGITHSIERPAVFRGWFKSKRSKKWLPDQVCHVVVFVELDTSETEVDTHLQLICDFADECYLKNTGKVQEEIWVLVSNVMQYSWKTTRGAKS